MKIGNSAKVKPLSTILTMICSNYLKMKIPAMKIGNVDTIFDIKN